MNGPVPESQGRMLRSLYRRVRLLRKTSARWRVATDFIWTNCVTAAVSFAKAWYEKGFVNIEAKDIVTSLSLAVAVCWTLLIEQQREHKENSEKLKDIQKQNDEHWTKHRATDEENLQRLLRGAEIVLRIDIHALDASHVSVMQSLLQNLDKDVTALFALDASLPAHWWSNSMLGYLAVQSKWASCDPRRAVHRIFVLSPMELGSTQGRKVICLHALMGFRTYIVTNAVFDRLYNDFTSREPSTPGKREFVIWDPCEGHPSKTTIPVKLKSKAIYGYQSFWLTSTPYEARESGDSDDLSNIKGERIDKVTWAEIKKGVQFELITGKFIDKAKAYGRFRDFLLSSERCRRCDDEDDVKITKNERPDVVEILGEIEGSGEPMDINTINSIIDRYLQFHSGRVR